MKVALINPVPMELHDMDERPMFSSFAEPLGLLYVAGVLKNNNYNVSILDQGGNNFSLVEVLNWIKLKDPDILGISVLTRSYLSGTKIAELAKEWNPNIIIVLGNYHTICADRIMKKNNFIDFCVRGEGEHTFLELIQTLEKGKTNFEKIKGLVYRENNRIKFTEPRDLEKNLDIFPIPDRSLLKNCDYKMAIGGIELSDKKSGTIIMSRGCPFKCRFCSVNHQSWRYRSIKNIVEELSLLESEGYKEIMIMDDNFTLNPKWVIDICNQIEKEKIDLFFHCEGRIEGTLEMYKEMKRANLKSIFFGMESGSQRILDYYNKNITPAKCKMAIKKARKANIDLLMASFIIGSPLETLIDIKKTIDFSLSLDIDYPMYHIFEVFPGIEIWDELVKQNKIDAEKYWETGIIIAEQPFFNLNSEILTGIIKRTYKKFYSLARPKFLLKQAIRTFQSSYRREKMANLARDFRSSLKLLDALSEKRF